MSALVTEHFVLQGTSSSTVSESGSRVSIYLSALSSGLVAIGFAAAIALALALAIHAAAPVPVVAGLAGEVLLLTLSLLYEHLRLAPAVLSGPAPAADQ